MTMSPSTRDQLLAAYETSGHNITQTAKALHMNRTTVQGQLHRLGVYGGAGEKITTPKVVPLFAEPARTRVVLMTAAQDDTDLCPGALENLKAYAASRGGEIFIGGFTYNKKLFSDHETWNAHFHHSVTPFLQLDIVPLAPKLLWHGDFNCLPTATNPLSGWETNSRDSWAVFPHAKIALQCVPVMPGRPGKQLMTTGVVTKPNYIDKNAGQKAKFHHTAGATIAEIQPDGVFFLRQIHMGSDGSFQDLDVYVKDGKVSRAPPVEAVNWGDIHIEEMDAETAQTAWGYDCAGRAISSTNTMLDNLRPRHQFFHDTFSFYARSPFTRHDAHERHMRVVEGMDSVEDMLDQISGFLSLTRRPWCKSVFVASNHNLMLDRWLKDESAAHDPANALIWHRLNLAYHEAIKAGDFKFSPHVHAIANRRHDLSDVAFLSEGESYLICQATHPVECGLHGHVGPRGSKGSPAGLSKIVERINGGHIHEPRIVEGAYFAGTSSRFDLHYAVRGPGAWHHSQIVTYPSGKRTIVTFQGGKYRA